MNPDDLAQLEQRVGAATTWLAEHDPGSRFHAWWQAGLTPLSPLPAHEATPEVRAAWAEYFRWRGLYEKLESQLSRAEHRGKAALPEAVHWQGDVVRP